MTTLNWKSTVVWSLLGLMFLLFALVVGPAPALAGGGVVLYEVTEDMYLCSNPGSGIGDCMPTADPGSAKRRVAVASLTGYAAFGTPICPAWVQMVAPKAKSCVVNAAGADNISLDPTDPNFGKGTVGGSFSVVIQGDNDTDAPEFVVTTGTFKGNMDFLARFLPGSTVQTGALTGGVGTVDADANGSQESAFTFTGTFRLPFSIERHGKHGKPIRGKNAYYQDDRGKAFPVQGNEKSIGFPTVRLEINF